MAVNSIKYVSMAAVAVVAAASFGCGEFVRESRAPVQLVITRLEAAKGDDVQNFFAHLLSDVSTGGTAFNDVGRVTMRLILKDPGQPGVTNAPSVINQVTVTRFRVVYRRADGRNTPGVDVPFPFDGGVTFTVPSEGEVSSGFQLVRNVAKLEPPLAALVTNPVAITTIAEVTFFGRDQAGNSTSATGSIQIDFANFADEE